MLWFYHFEPLAACGQKWERIENKAIQFRTNESIKALNLSSTDQSHPRLEDRSFSNFWRPEGKTNSLLIRVLCEREKSQKLKKNINVRMILLIYILWFICLISALGSNKVLCITTIVQERLFSMSQSVRLSLLNHWDRLIWDSFQTNSK